MLRCAERIVRVYRDSVYKKNNLILQFGQKLHQRELNFAEIVKILIEIHKLFEWILGKKSLLTVKYPRNSSFLSSW